MDKLEQYRNAIKKILTEYYEMSNSQDLKNGEIESSERLAFDEKRDQYIWFRFGWDDKKHIQHIIIYLCIKNEFGLKKMQLIYVLLMICYQQEYLKPILF
jgi:hypothetical protein